jgi:hypothetical protein
MTPERFTASETGDQPGDDASHAPPPERPSGVTRGLTIHDDEPVCTECGASERACSVKADCSGRRCCSDCSHVTPWGW